MRTLLHDPVPEALERGLERVRARAREVGREGPRAARTPPGLLEPVSTLDELAPCELVIEAAPERPELKRELFGALSVVCGDDVVLATNTSSIPVTSLAGAAARPENVVGMHFFNPPPLMRAARGDPRRPDRRAGGRTARGEPARRWARTVIVAADGPGFLVNRCGRPFGGEGAAAAPGAGRPRTSRSTASAGSAAASGWARSS